MGGKEYMVIDSAVMSDVISAPEDNVIADSGEGLYGVIF